MNDPIARTPYCHKIRYGIAGAPTLTDDEMDGSHAPGVGLEPVLIELIYSAALKDRPASVTASVTGLWTRFGKREQPERTVTTHFTNGPSGWPVWLAAEARLHDPDAPAAAVSVPAADQAAVLREAVRRIEDGELLPDRDLRFRRGADWVFDALRRLAAEAAVPAVGVAADTTPAAPGLGCGCPDEDAVEHMFGGGDCTCVPWTRQGGKPRVLGPKDTVDMIGGWERGLDCPHHRPAVPEQRCAHCGQPVRQVTGTLSAWWVHDPDGHTACHPENAAASTRAEPGPVVPAQPGGEPYAGDERPCLACGHTMDSHIRINGEIDCVFHDCTDPTPEPARQPGNDTPVVAYRSHSGSLLRCLTHAPDQTGLNRGAFHPVTAGDLPDGGVCTYRAPGVECGVDVLNPQQPKEA